MRPLASLALALTLAVTATGDAPFITPDAVIDACLALDPYSPDRTIAHPYAPGRRYDCSFDYSTQPFQE